MQETERAVRNRLQGCQKMAIIRVDHVIACSSGAEPRQLWVWTPRLKLEGQSSYRAEKKKKKKKKKRRRAGLSQLRCPGIRPEAARVSCTRSPYETLARGLDLSGGLLVPRNRLRAD